MQNYTHWGYLLSCLAPKITACCYICCYGLCVPMGWLVEQRMGEHRLDCRWKQVLYAFEDAHWLQAKWIWKSRCTCTNFNSQSADNQNLNDPYEPRLPPHPSNYHLKVTGKWRKWTDRLNLAVIVMKPLLSKDIWSIIHCLCLQLVQPE